MPSAPQASLDIVSLAEHLSWVNYITAQAGGEGGIPGEEQEMQESSPASLWVCQLRGV